MDSDTVLKIIGVIITLGGSISILIKAYADSRSKIMAAQADLIKAEASRIQAAAAVSDVSVAERKAVLDAAAETKAALVKVNNQLETANQQLTRLLRLKNTADPDITDAETNAIHNADKASDAASAAS